jgi:hypothetical protein
LVTGYGGAFLIREIAPVITALICAGKVSSGIGAELGSMKVTEQIDAGSSGNQSVQIPGGDPYFSDDTNGSSTCNICRWRWYAWRIYWYKYAWRRQSFRYISKVFDSFMNIIRRQSKRSSLVLLE